MLDVSIRGLTKRYGDVAAVRALDLHVNAGELVALLGPSGCGKTTTLRLVAGFLTPEAGEIWVGDRCLSSPATVIPPERRRMAMIFQSYALWPHMTVARNIAYGLRFNGVARADRDRRVKDMLRVVQLEGYGSRYPGELSGGQQQRVAVARALVVEPEILLLDEPLSNLDANLREEMRFEIRRLHDTFGITTLYVTHDQAEAMVISDRVAVLQAGRIVQIGTAEELFERPADALRRRVHREDQRDRWRRGEPEPGGPGQAALAGRRRRSEARGPGRHLDPSPPDRDRARTGRRRPPLPTRTCSRGTVQRASYLGDAVDYQVAIDEGGIVLRVAGPPPPRVRVGESVSLRIAAASCVPLASGGAAN